MAKLREIRALASAAAIALAALVSAAPAAAIELTGAFTQGGLVRGRVDPGSHVEVDGREVRISPQGIFLVGFGRDAGPYRTVTVRGPDGTVEERVIEIASREFPVQRIDGLPRAKVTPSEADLVRIRADAALIRAARRRDEPRTDFLGGFDWPLEGRVSGVFGSQRILNGEPRQPHSGLDLAAPAGTPVHTPASGVVSLAEHDMFFTGKTLMIDHGFGLVSIFAHLSRIRVAVGDRIERGAVVAEVGATGRVTGPHLHWGVSLGAIRLDPALLVEQEW